MTQDVAGTNKWRNGAKVHIHRLSNDNTLHLWWEAHIEKYISNKNKYEIRWVGEYESHENVEEVDANTIFPSTKTTYHLNPVAPVESRPNEKVTESSKRKRHQDEDEKKRFENILEEIKEREKKIEEREKKIEEKEKKRQREEKETFYPPETNYQISINGHVCKSYHKGGNVCAAVKATQTKYGSKIDSCDIQNDVVPECRLCFPSEKRNVKTITTKKNKRKREENVKKQESNSFMLNGHLCYATIHHPGLWSGLPMTFFSSISSEQRYLMIKDIRFVWSKHSNESLNQFLNRLNNHITLEVWGKFSNVRRCVRDLIPEQLEQWLKA